MNSFLMRAVVACLAAASLVASTFAEEATLRTYYVEAKLMSIIPETGLTSLKNSGEVSGSPGSGLGLDYRSETRSFDVFTKVAMQKGRFLTFVTVTPARSDKQTPKAEQKFDLTDLKPQTYEIAKDADGRVYQLLLVPTAVEHRGPRPFNTADFRLDHMNFPHSPVVLNDREYLGTMGVTGTDIASVELPGVGDLEFCLRQFKGSEPLGQLHGGVLTIRHDKDTLTISNVSNGSRSEVLETGPYEVWVRWEPPTQTIEEYQAAFREELKALKKQAESANSTLSDDLVERLKKWETSGTPRVLSCGSRQFTAKDVVPPK
jgi:hypothetical protein